ncbi:nitronate monooxygenase family protein [Sphingomonas sp. J315]|uniref:NAD(P)H-dependent flavin oxidoreductase n=1 Tax=Sphingomonas sp. J315 TaxID=2898433 RepID=UPI0021ADB610|nr:nitronate monooxygenase [Sphingomonas sp. J315]UUY00735.1 nitronate monooxygenase [Sphingomonas sp. J315]
MAIAERLRCNLELPVMVAPMFLISNPALTIAACKAGIIGTFPSLNARSAADYESWLEQIGAALDETDAAYGVNLIVGKQNGRLAEDLAITVRRQVPLVITSFGADHDVVAAVHDYGGTVFHDVASARHAEIAAQAGVDGLIVLTTGAGGHTGWLNPFAVLNEVRAVFDGTILLAGGMSTGRDVAAARMMGADLAYMGTRFIATREASVHPDYHAMLIASRAKDVLATRGISGTPANFLTRSLTANGLDPALFQAATGPLPVLDERGLRPWKDIWSAGQGVGAITDVPSVAELVERLSADYAAAIGAVSPP